MDAWRMLDGRMPDSISRDQMDQALAHYAYGLTRPLYAERSAKERIDAIISLLTKALPEKRVTLAIHSKQSGDERFSNICGSLARLGERDALTIINSNSHCPLGSELKQTHYASVGSVGAEGASKWRRST